MTFVFNLLKEHNTVCQTKCCLFFVSFEWQPSQRSTKFMALLFGLRGRIVFVASLGDFKSASCSSVWICFTVGLVVFFLSHVQKLARGNWGATGMQSTTSACDATVCQSVYARARVAGGTLRLENVQECVFDRGHVVRLDAIWGEDWLLFTAEMHNPAEYCSVGSRWVRLS